MDRRHVHAVHNLAFVLPWISTEWACGIGTVDTVSKVGTGTFRLVSLPPTPPQAVDVVTCHLPHRIIIEVSDSASVKFAGRLPRGDSVIFIAGGWYIYDHIWYTDTSKEVILNLSAINLELGVDSKLDCKITLASLGASSAFIRFLRFYPYGPMVSQFLLDGK